MKKNKFIKLLILFFVVMFCTSFNASAEKFTGHMKLGEWVPVYVVKNKDYLQGRIILRSEDNAFLYCLQPFIMFDPDKAGEYEVTQQDYASVLNLTADQWRDISLIAYFGYGYGNHTESKWYMITQVMIWRIIEPNASIYFTNSLNGTRNDNLFVSEINEINGLVDDFKTIPNLGSKSVALNIGESTTLTDSAGVLHNYEIKSKSNVEARIDGDSLVVTSTGVGNGNVTLIRKLDSLSVPPIVYFKDNLQNVMSRGDADPINLSINFSVTGGGVSVHKIDEKGNGLTGVKIIVENSKREKVCTITTVNGSGSCEDLPFDTYTLYEESTIEGYVKSDEFYTATLDANHTSAVVEMVNERIKGYIDLYKYDKENNSATPQGDAVLKGAVYGIYDWNNKRVGELVTDSNGYARSEPLEYSGDNYYTVREEKPSVGYQLDTNEYKVKIKEHNVTINVTSKEQVYKFDFHLLKVRTDGTTGVIEAEPNATFDVILKSSNKKYGTITTDDRGITPKITLPFGVYKVCQTKGYNGSQMAPCFEINISDKDVERIVNNGPISARLKVIKVDKDTHQIIARKNLRFKIFDVTRNRYVCQTVAYPSKETFCEFKTDGTGSLITPFPLDAGVYRLEEVDQPLDGYLWNSVSKEFTIDSNTDFTSDDELGVVFEVRFENTQVKGRVVVNKFGEKPVIENNRFTYVEVPLKNTTFKIIADEDIMIGGRLYYSKGDFVGRIDLKDTNELGDLPLGKYLLIEEKTDENHILSTDPIPFELKYKDQYTPEVVVEINVKNYYKKGDFDFTKVDLVDGKPVPDTDIKIYTENDELVFDGTTDGNGHILIKDLPVNVKLYLVETKANEKYRLSDEKIYFMIKENGEVVKGVMTNEKITSIIKLVKLDDHGHPVKGAVYELYNSAGELMGTYETDRKGRIEVELPYDDYYWKEVKTLKHLVLNTDLIPFKVRVDGEVIKLKTIRSKVKLYKTDDKGVPQKGIKYNLYDKWDNLLGTYETNDKGYIEVELEYGKYYWKEIETLENLVLNTEEIPFTVDTDGEVIELSAVNDIIRSKVKLYKTDDKGIPQKGIKYNLFDKDNNLLGTYETDENGYIEVELEYGEYYWLEVETLENLVLNTEKIPFVVDTDGEVIEFSAVNDIIRSKVKLHKTDESGNPLVGVKFELYDINDNFLGSYTTDDNGDIELELEYGYYYWKEVETLEHYELNPEKQYFEITENGKVIEFTMVNIRVPDTQTKNNHIVEILGGIAILFGIGGIVYEYTKEKYRTRKQK